jgi:hypothetical protein
LAASLIDIWQDFQPLMENGNGLLRAHREVVDDLPTPHGEREPAVNYATSLTSDGFQPLMGNGKASIGFIPTLPVLAVTVAPLMAAKGHGTKPLSR